MYYIRKLSNNSNLSKIKNTDNVASLDSDILKQELATTGNALSFWKCEDLENQKDTMIAILLSGSHIKVSQFFILDDDMISKYGLELDDSKPGKTGYKGFQNLHVDIKSLTYRKIGIVLEMMQEAFQNEELTPKLGRLEIKQYLKEVKEAGLLDETQLDDNMKKAIANYCG